MKCEICNNESKDIRGLSIHLVKKHHFNKNDIKNYYDKYLKKDNEGKCYFCGKDSIFKDLSKGYHRICESKECLSKTRATGTYEFLMYKYNLSKDDAIKLMNKRASERGKKIKKSLNERFENNENFFKERSHQSIKYWLKKGYSDNDAKIKVKEVTDMIHEKTWEKRRNNPDLYKDVNTTQIAYWLKKGYNEKEAKEKVKDRQRTFTLEKCIKKYGEDDGTNIWIKRNKRWSKKMKDILLKNGNYKQDSSNIEKIFINDILNETNINEYNCYINKQFMIFCNSDFYYTYDFKYNNKIIEFNGDYWHCNPIKYDMDYFNMRKQMYAKDIWKYDKLKIQKAKKEGYDVLVVWENDYKKNKEKIIQECVDFLNK